MNYLKIREFLVISLSAISIGLFSMQGGNSENYERAIWVSYFILIFYYLYTSNEDIFKPKEGKVFINRVLPTIFILGATLLVTNILTAVTQSVTDLNYCAGWAQSEKYCAIDKVNSRYNSDPREYDGY